MPDYAEQLDFDQNHIRTLDTSGNEWVYGKVTAGVTVPTTIYDLTSKGYVDDQLATKAGTAVATTTTAGLMSAQDKQNLDRVSLSESTAVTLSGGTSVTVNDAHQSPLDEFTVQFDPQISVVPNKNLLNPATNIEGYWIGATGKMTAQEGDWYTDLIPVEPGDRIYVSGYHNQTTNGNKRLHGYNANGDWVMQLNFASVPANAYPPAAKYSFNATISDSRVCYMRFSYRMADTNVMIEKDQETQYEPYGERYEFTAYTNPVTVTKTANSSAIYSFSIPSLYAGTADILTGNVTTTWGHIDSYNGETLTGDWWSTNNNNSSTSLTPTIGDEVIYELDTPTTSQGTGLSLTTDTGSNTFTIDKGVIDTFTYEADGAIISNLNVTSGVITLGQTSLSEQQLTGLLQLLS